MDEAGTGFIYGANFSIGVNLFYEVARTARCRICSINIWDKFSNGITFTRKMRRRARRQNCKELSASASETELEITSFREGDVVGMHEVVLDSPNDTIYLCHDAKSRRGFAEGAVKAAEWLAGKIGFFDFREVWRQL